MVYPVASCLIGAVVGLLSVAIFAVILRRKEQNRPTEAIMLLTSLIGTVLGAGAADYIIFDILLQQNAIGFYLIGLATWFLPLGLWVFIDWMRPK
jgi:hypothetical protein